MDVDWFIIENVLYNVWAILGDVQYPLRDIKIAYVFYNVNYWIFVIQDWIRVGGIGK